MNEKMKQELKEYVYMIAFDGWKDATDDSVMEAIDDFFQSYQPERGKREDHYIGGYFLPPWNLNEHPEKTEGWIAFQEEQRKNPKYYGCGTTIYTTTGVAN
jgi:hypothetical protein